MDDVGPHLLPVLVDVGHIELLGQQLVDLDGDEGIFLAKDILVLDIQLGAVEGGFIDADGVLDAKVIEDSFHDALGLIPLLRSTLVLFVGLLGSHWEKRNVHFSSRPTVSRQYLASSRQWRNSSSS